MESSKTLAFRDANISEEKSMATKTTKAAAKKTTAKTSAETKKTAAKKSVASKSTTVKTSSGTKKPSAKNTSSKNAPAKKTQTKTTAKKTAVKKNVVAKQAAVEQKPASQKTDYSDKTFVVKEHEAKPLADSGAEKIRILTADTKNFLLNAQRNEETESIIYKKVAAFVKDEKNKNILLQISGEEKKHAGIWEKITGVKVQPHKGKIFWYTLQIGRASCRERV